MTFLGGSDKRSWSPARRREYYLTVGFFVSSLFFAAVFAIVGYTSESEKLRSARNALVANLASDPAVRTEALDHIDEAIRAKYEKRTTGALAGLDRARRADPSVPGLDAAFAEIALNEKQFIEMRAAAGAARRKGDHAAGASVLLGMDKWINREASDREMSVAADAASAYFAEATESDYFHAPAWFFWGDVLRYAGREDEGMDRSLAALYRFNAWDSSDVVSAKIVFASSESGDPVFGSLEAGEGSPWAQAIEDFGARSSAERADLASLAPFAARQVMASLSSDPFVSAAKAVPGPQPDAPKLP